MTTTKTTTNTNVYPKVINGIGFDYSANREKVILDKIHANFKTEGKKSKTLNSKDFNSGEFVVYRECLEDLRDTLIKNVYNADSSKKALKNVLIILGLSNDNITKASKGIINDLSKGVIKPRQAKTSEHKTKETALKDAIEKVENDKTLSNEVKRAKVETLENRLAKLKESLYWDIEKECFLEFKAYEEFEITAVSTTVFQREFEFILNEFLINGKLTIKTENKTRKSKWERRAKQAEKLGINMDKFHELKANNDNEGWNKLREEIKKAKPTIEEEEKKKA